MRWFRGKSAKIVDWSDFVMDVMRESYFQLEQIKFLAESVLVSHVSFECVNVMMNEAIWSVIAWPQSMQLNG